MNLGAVESASPEKSGGTIAVFSDDNGVNDTAVDDADGVPEDGELGGAAPVSGDPAVDDENFATAVPCQTATAKSSSASSCFASSNVLLRDSFAASTRNKVLFLVTPQAPSNRDQLLYLLPVLCLALSTKLTDCEVAWVTHSRSLDSKLPHGAFKLQIQRYALDLTISNKDFEETVRTCGDGLTNHNRGKMDWTSIWNARWRCSK
jgi:hypothetical protein